MLKIFQHRQDTQYQKRKAISRQASRKTVPQPFNIEWKMPAVLMVVALLLITTLILLSPEKDILPIEKIRIAGDFTHLDSTRIEAQLKPYLGRGFFSVDILEIQQVLKQQAWIRNVSVRRLWPNQISVSIVEKQVAARWDDDHLLSSEANIFEADSKIFNHLPIINGYKGQSDELLSRFRSLQHKFYEYDIQIIKMSEDSKGALGLSLNNGLVVNLGSEDNERKIDNFLKVYREQIKPRVEHIRHIDFRYNNGFAIAWKKEHLEKMSKLRKRGIRNV